jgi:hypothetical protein
MHVVIAEQSSVLFSCFVFSHWVSTTVLVESAVTAGKPEADEEMQAREYVWLARCQSFYCIRLICCQVDTPLVRIVLLLVWAQCPWGCRMVQVMSCPAPECQEHIALFSGAPKPTKQPPEELMSFMGRS